MQSDNQIDKFESRFKSAYKKGYNYQNIEFSKITLITRKNLNHAKKIQEISSNLLPQYKEQYEWSLLPEDSFSSVREVLEKIEEFKPDIIISERNIKVTEESLVYGLSPYVETITQVTQTPVLLLANQSTEQLEASIQNCDKVLAETNRLTGDDRIINWAVAFARPNGSLHLNHIEDSKTFNRYAEVLEKIPEINSALAQTKLKEELLKLPSDFISSVEKVLKTEVPELTVEGFVVLGHSIKDYKKFIETHEIDLLIVNSKNEDHLAMEGIAYEIAVEFKSNTILFL